MLKQRCTLITLKTRRLTINIQIKRKRLGNERKNNEITKIRKHKINRWTLRKVSLSRRWNN